MSHRRSALTALAVAVVLSAMGAGPGPVRAVAVARQADQTTTTTAAPPVTEPTTTTSVTAPVVLTPDPTTVPVAPVQPGDGSGAPGSDATPPTGDGGGPEAGDPASAGLVLDDRERTGDSSTADLLDALQPLTALGFTEEEAYILGMGKFPVAGLATWSDDFHDPRYNPIPHLHQGACVSTITTWCAPS